MFIGLLSLHILKNLTNHIANSGVQGIISFENDSLNVYIAETFGKVEANERTWCAVKEDASIALFFDLLFVTDRVVDSFVPPR